MKKKSRLELNVGLFVFLGIIILAFFIFKVGDLRIIKPGYHLRLIFGFTSGLKVNAPVRFTGVEAGEVKSIRTFFDPKINRIRVEVLVWLRSDVKVPSDSKAWINTLGLLGEKYVEIIPGKNFSNYLKDEDILVGEDPISIQEIGRLTKEIALKINSGIESLNRLVNDQELKKSLKKIMLNLEEITTKIRKGEGSLGKLLTEDKLYKDLEALVDDLKRHPWKLLHKPKQKKKR